MSFLSGKRILLGITAGIAAYKTASLVRLFIKCGAEVKVVMTPSAKDFITPLTLSTLSKNPVYSSFTSEEDENEVWNNHVELGLWADFFVIAPTTANTLAKMANGICDNLLMATYLSAKCPIYFAPAMDLDMYKHESTKTSIERLQEFGNILIPPGTGELASGLVGEGRMAEPEEIVEFIENSISSNLALNGITVLITAGPTYEAIDPVRFIGNHSSGKMGYAIAEAALKFGARVILVSGPTSESLSHKNLTIVDVMGAEEMYQNVHKYFGESDIAILSAAVADYRPKTVSKQKIKKQDSTFSIELVKTKDILASLGEIKKEKFLVGFALETENELYNAKKKLANKNLDLIVLNSLNDDGAGFGTLTNKVTFITAQGDVFEEGLKSKMEVAEDLIKLIVTSYVI
ncbi:bifunctional phosphopantothenoylcysteine decarboxylase/phosphopantothenate--cysteine ligase CoaBC [Aegicerativicinus sediminis]|uniref:bifunctional phosphopantothenoylcysteine decarboxylase/phosphopantothenate--cysteine ligase CoaBC n=1 Tax=Aegicerativicinus sediminis TaxID=2893202 RepID=UPI001E5CEFE2|nr:bifunctional phosphopantothenoylcysteine decarboxylase/phosphopantothenate--cysteine ligase CoaBC [Aegicerativicinus sediminis]